MKIIWKEIILGFFWAFNFAVITTQGSVYLERNHNEKWVIGLHGASYYLSAGIASLFLPSVIKGFGTRPVLLIGISGAGLPAIFYALANNSTIWLLIRIIHGFFSALTIIAMELLVFQKSAEESKAGNFGLFELSLAVGAGFGSIVAPFLENVYSGLAFYSSGILAFFSLLFVPNNKGLLAPEGESNLSWEEFWKLIFFFGTAFTQGFLEGGILAYLGVSLMHQHYPDTQISLIYAFMFIGIIVSMAFITRFADYWGGRRVLFISHLVSFLALMSINFVSIFPVWCGGLFFVGSAVGCQYAIALVEIGRFLNPTKQPSGNSMYLAFNCIGSVMGPLVLGAVLTIMPYDIIPLVLMFPVAVMIFGCSFKVMKKSRNGLGNG